MHVCIVYACTLCMIQDLHTNLNMFNIYRCVYVCVKIVVSGHPAASVTE